MTRSIFITNNGLADRIGQAQVLPYLEGLAGRGHQIACLSVESANTSDPQRQDLCRRLDQAGILHVPLQRQAKTLARKLGRFTMPRLLSAKLDELIADFQPDLMHCRSYMPLGPVLKANQKHDLPFIFDMRGFWIDERLEAGIWSGTIGKSYAQHFRKLEAQAVAKASSVITLTHDAKRVVIGLGANARNIDVIPCCVDQSKFRPDRTSRAAVRNQLGFSEYDIVLMHLGSCGPLYRMDVTYRLIAALKAKGARAKLLLLGEKDATPHIQSARANGITLDPADLRALSVPHHRVPAFINASDVGLSFRLPSRSSLGVSATKVGEYQSCGLPVISNRGVGDIEQLLNQGDLGLVLDNLSDQAICNLADQLLTSHFAPPASISRRAGYFSMASAVQQYDAIYRQHSMLKAVA